MIQANFYKIIDNPMFLHEATHTNLHVILDISQQKTHLLAFFEH